MMIDALFRLNKAYPVTFSVMAAGEIEGQPTEPVETEILSCKCLCVKGAASQKYVSDRMKPDVTATIMLRPKDYKVKVPDGAKATVEGVGVFSVIYPDNVGGQGEAIVIPCKEFV